MKNHRSIRIIGLFVILLVGVFLLSQTQRTYAQVDCQVDYVVTNQWASGFQANVTITNNGTTAVSGWALDWTFAGNEQLGSGWNADFASTGQAVTVSNQASHWNGTIGSNGGSVAFGFTGSHSGDVRVPASFTVNGVVCNGDTPVPTNTVPAPTNTVPAPTNTPVATATDVPVSTNTPVPTATIPSEGQRPFPDGSSAKTIPGLIQAEDYDLGGFSVAYYDATSQNSGSAYRNDGVDIQATTDNGGGYNVGWIASGEWLEYTVNVASTDTYNFDVRVASQSSGGTLHLEVDGIDVTGSINFAATGGWQTWTTVSANNISLTSGTHVVRLVMDSSNFNVNWLEFANGSTEPTPVPSPTATTEPGGFPYLGRGMNLGNKLEAPVEGTWGPSLEAWNFPVIAQAGFDSVRMPIRWNSDRALTTAPYTIDQNFLVNRVQWGVDQALANDLTVVINMHHYDEMYANPYAEKDRFLAMWQQIADHFKDYPNDKVVFEILNEPHDNLTAEIWNDFLAEAHAVIRQSNPNRTIMIGSAEWGGIEGMNKLVLPNDDNMIFTVHYYEPFPFTHQGAEWTTPEMACGVAWGTDAEKAQVRQRLDEVATWAQQRNNIHVYVGEFGVYKRCSDPVDQAEWVDFVARESEARGFSWAYWEFNAGFGAHGETQGAGWYDYLLNALIPPGS